MLKMNSGYWERDHLIKYEVYIMVKSVFAQILLVSFLAFSVGCGVYKYTINCQTYYSQLSSLTALVCANIGRTNLTLINACTVCFQSAITNNQNQPSLTQLSVCANTYLTGTNYAPCAAILANDAVSLAGIQTSGCQTGFCNFVRCARRINSNLLISTCYNQVAATNTATTDADRVRLYTNVTSCILARARCNPVNPITGQTQNNRFTTTTVGCFGPTTRISRLYNTLQITAGGDLQVVALPGTTTVSGQFCSPSTSLVQSGWTNVNCP